MGLYLPDAPEPSEDIKNRFSYHPPTTEKADAHDKTRGLIMEVASILDGALPPGREHAMVLTKLEEAMFWANAAIARKPQRVAYAESTSVTPEKSQAEIAKLLLKYGANGFTYGWDDGFAQVAFRAHERVVRFTVPLPDPDDRQFRVTATGRMRTNPESAYDQEVRRRWRAMVLVIKAKLEAVNTGVTTFEDEFMAHIVLPDGRTVGDVVRERIKVAYELGKAIDLLPGLPGGLSGPARSALPPGNDSGAVDAEVVDE